MIIFYPEIREFIQKMFLQPFIKKRVTQNRDRKYNYTEKLLKQQNTCHFCNCFCIRSEKMFFNVWPMQIHFSYHGLCRRTLLLGTLTIVTAPFMVQKEKRAPTGKMSDGEISKVPAGGLENFGSKRTSFAWGLYCKPIQNLITQKKKRKTKQM